MAANVGEWSSTPADNTSLGSVSLLENVMLVNAVNNAFREMMAQVATGIANGDFAGVAIPFTPASASTPAYLDFAEDTDNGTNRVRLIGPASTADVEVTLPAATDTLVGKATTDTLTNKTLTSPVLTTPAITDPIITGTILEDVYTISDGAAFEIDPGNGSIQQVTLGANRTPAATNFANGESLTLMVDDGTARTLTWTTVDVNWTGGAAPTLATTGWTVIELWKVGGQIFGAHVGDAAA